MDLGIDLNVWPWIWLIVAIIFSVVELTLIAGTFILLPFAVSALAAALLAFADVAVVVQWLVFFVGGGALFAFLYRMANRFITGRDLPPGVGAERLLGLAATVTEGIPDHSAPNTGVVAVEGEIWRAVSERGPIPSGTRVEIIAVRGTRVVVRLPEEPFADKEHP